MSNSKLNVQLKYLNLENCPDEPDNYPAQPVLVKLKGNKTKTKLIPINPLTEYDKCMGCIAEAYTEGSDRARYTECFQLPKCEGAIYVRATPTTILRHIEWRLENDK